MKNFVRTSLMAFTVIVGFAAHAAEITSDDKETQRICQQLEKDNNVGAIRDQRGASGQSSGPSHMPNQ